MNWCYKRLSLEVFEVWYWYLDHYFIANSFSTQHCLRIIDYNTIDFARAIEYSKTYSISISAPPPSSPKAVSSYLSLILQASVLQSNFLPYLYGMMMMMHAMPLVSNIKNKQNFASYIPFIKFIRYDIEHQIQYKTHLKSRKRVS